MLGTNTLGEIGLGEILAANDDTPPVPVRRGGDDAPVRQRRRLRPEDIIAIVEAARAAEETKPQPTKKQRKALTSKIVDEVWEDTIFAPARKPVEQFVRQEVAQFYKPGVSWAEIHAAVTRIIDAAQAEARRIEQEIEDEDEFLILLAA
jgi:D-aminopeptidase